MLVRVRSQNGSARYELSPNDDIQVLVEKILNDAPEADPSTLALSNQPNGGEKPVSSVRGTLNQLGIKHGDLYFASYKTLSPSGSAVPINSSVYQQAPQPTSSSSGLKNDLKGRQAWKDAKEHAVDVLLEKDDGKIPRKRDVKFCRHGDKSMCDYCMPLEPYDAKHHAESGIKHLSFQAHLRKLNAATNKPESGASYIPPLEELNYQVAIPCPSQTHSPFPAGICSKCQPSAITLQLQQYRMVDHVEFATPALIENLLDFWRRTGCQRFGYLLGRYERYDQVPLGIKAVVEAVHEPPQQGELDGIQIGLPWDEEGKMEDLANLCGLQVLGMIYTDLTPDETTPEAKAAAKVLYKRHAQSFFLSSLETIFAAHQQAKRPNPSRFSASGRFSSKFVTCVITGNQDGSIDVTAYQASDQAVAMVKADMIEASVEPGTVRLKDEDRTQEQTSSSARYIPDVFYRYKNKYGIDIKENAKPCFPVDYLLVSLTHGFPADPSPSFRTPTPFPIENRAGLHDQSMDVVINRLGPVLRKVIDAFPQQHSAYNIKGKGKEQDGDCLLELQTFLSDWHLIAFIDTVGIFDRTDLTYLAKFALCQDMNIFLSAAEKLFHTNSWQTFMAILKETLPGPPVPARDYASQSQTANNGTAADGFPDIPADSYNDVQMGGTLPADEQGTASLACPHCTFENEPGTTDCMVCGLPVS
ncbi:uncharacterized protein MELLADRAFT_42071 [Melampsora larici-populina 98AG31]|uniref:Nuclear protein localization protein 4 n=1 Tax=Melampsora larici-populina (strain 98AG31 / pathotype 3-4-7) TaxID=747676 RepID=F4R9S3_MELLP|nr:uncharacterized protein MELLADRAFT_42071 [Melampsora larici-populina 98AG31]EGG11031.1 hypothetical protein MELLADRAFT_42071 [Melampsora larici-populina 98AG31]